MDNQEIEFSIADKDEAAEKAEKVGHIKELVETNTDLSDEDRDLITQAIYAWLHDNLDEDPDEDETLAA